MKITFHKNSYTAAEIALTTVITIKIIIEKLKNKMPALRFLEMTSPENESDKVCLLFALIVKNAMIESPASKFIQSIRKTLAAASETLFAIINERIESALLTA